MEEAFPFSLNSEELVLFICLFVFSCGRELIIGAWRAARPGLRLLLANLRLMRQGSRPGAARPDLSDFASEQPRSGEFFRVRISFLLAAAS